MLNPYESINWNSIITIPSVSHAHSRAPQRTMNLVNLCVPNLGQKLHLNLSNYHGSYPLYPLTDLKSIPYFEKREWCRIANDPETEEALLEADRVNFIPSKLQNYVDNIDLSKIIECPNAEHHRFRINGSDPVTYNKWHMNSVGSTWASGHSPIDEDQYGNGAGIEWTEALDDIFDNLLYPDGGGVTINHPNWTGTHLTLQRVLDTLDYDDRVLGIEIYNDGDREATTYPRYADNYVDAILATGRRCWIFAVPDHTHETQHPNDWRGVNVLLCSSLDNHECLRAYRNGNFYAKIKPDSNLKFTSITFSNGTIAVSTTNATTITIITDGVPTEISGSSASRYIGTNHIYCRVVAATNDADDLIFSNPIMLDGKKTRDESQDMVLLYS